MSDDEDLRMPPAASDKPRLKREQVVAHWTLAHEVAGNRLVLVVGWLAMICELVLFLLKEPINRKGQSVHIRDGDGIGVIDLDDGEA